MQITEASPILSKTRELCEVILSQPEFQSLRRQIDDFMADETAKMQYQTLSEKGEHLQHKQMQGVHLTDSEVAEFEQERQRFFSNPVGKGFVDAQQSMQQLQETVGHYVTKTFELGRVPTENDFEGGGCGTGCGCH
jgi:cell fate (sporulation/competence/biofilm development) regulator YlbF (YheA/YmcA/DUF963 family)